MGLKPMEGREMNERKGQKGKGGGREGRRNKEAGERKRRKDREAVLYTLTPTPLHYNQFTRLVSKSRPLSLQKRLHVRK